jgi:hypothetical protein
MSSPETGQIPAGTTAVVLAMAAFGALTIGAAVGLPGFLIGALAGALVGFLAWS